MLATLTLFGLLMAFALMLGAEAPAANLTPAEDDDEKELIASVGEGTAAKPKPKEDDAEDDDEPEDEPEGDEPEVVETAAAEDAAADATRPESSGVSGGSGGDKPVPEVAAPAAPAGSDEPTGVVPQPDPDAFNADPIIKRLDSAIEKIEKNELIEDYEKETKIAALLEQREGRVTKLAETQVKQENAIRNAKAKQLGITRAQLDGAWTDACAETKKVLGRDSYDAAMLVLSQKAQAIKAKAPKNGHPTPVPPKVVVPKAVAPTPITPQGARVAPPAAIVPPPPKKLTDEQELVESVRKAQKSGVRL